MQRVRWLTLVLVAVLACGVPEAKRKAELLAEEYFAAAQGRSLVPLLELYDERFYQQTSRQEWERILSGVWQVLGSPGKHELSGWQVNYSTQLGRVIVLTYQVTYSSELATEVITVAVPDEGPPKIVGHHFNSKGLLPIAPEKDQAVPSAA